MTKSVELWFDYGSAPAYLAYWALKDIARRTAANIELKPMLLGAVFKATGNHTPLDIKPKGKWMAWDMQNYARRYGVPFKWNEHMVFNTMPLMRAALVALQRDELEPFSDAIFNAMWAAGQDLGQPAIVERTFEENGFDVAAYLKGIRDQQIKDDLKRRSQEAVDRGLFGAPTIFVGENMWWGQDRLDWVEAALSDDDS